MAQPNVLFLMVDQWPGALLGCAGHPVIQTPTIDQLARLGTRFSRMYSESPICIPARRTIMTGTSPRTHGDRSFKPAARMPNVPLLANCFRDAGFQATAVGKLHVYPQRDRIGFDEALIAEEGRLELGTVDDYDIYLAEQGFAGQQFLHGMSNNDYQHRPWHLAEQHHVTNWTTREAARTIKRRDPTKPGFWHVSYTHPHPPLVPLASYMDFYRDLEIDDPITGDWAKSFDDLPPTLHVVQSYWPERPSSAVLRGLRRAYYALCTHIDHQIRILIGTLRDEGLLDNTIIALTSDHGDMLGEHGLWSKCLFYERSSNVPFILVGTSDSRRVAKGVVDDRLLGLQDMMPTLLDLAGISIPETVEGLSACSDRKRDILYGECREARSATRMVHDGRHKLIWYPAGNHIQLFDLERDPSELRDVAGDAAYADVRHTLERVMSARLYGPDVEWSRDSRLVGYSPDPYVPQPSRTYGNQRGLHFPQPPAQQAEKSGAQPG